MNINRPFLINALRLKDTWMQCLIQRGDYKSYAEYAGKPDNVGEGDIGGNPRVSENFMIVEEGILWAYNEYEIASYSEGHTDVLVPWKSIMPYLKSKKIEMK